VYGNDWINWGDFWNGSYNQTGDNFALDGDQVCVKVKVISCVRFRLLVVSNEDFYLSVFNFLILSMPALSQFVYFQSYQRNYGTFQLARSRFFASYTTLCVQLSGLQAPKHVAAIWFRFADNGLQIDRRHRHCGSLASVRNATPHSVWYQITGLHNGGSKHRLNISISVMSKSPFYIVCYCVLN